VTRGSTYENKANLAPQFLDTIITKYEGTRLGRQELQAEMLDDTPGALWRREWLDRDRYPKERLLPGLRRIVVVVDPVVSSGEGSDETGIIVAGVDREGHGYVLADESGRYAPHEWARKAIVAYEYWNADRIIGEINNGGDMIENTLRMIDGSVPY